MNSDRRSFLACMTSAAMMPAVARSSPIDPIPRPARANLRLSLAAYSLRNLLTKEDSPWDLFRFVDYCHAQGLSGAELTSYYFPKDVSHSYLVDLKEHCHRLGVTISGGAIRNDFCQRDPAKVELDIEHTLRWIDRYAILGAPVIRIFAGNQPKEESWEHTIDRCVRACEQVSRYAYEKGVYLGLENHGGVTAQASGLLEIVRRVNAKSFGVNFDSGNFRSTDDPYQELTQIAPYAVNAQIKAEIFPNGKQKLVDLDKVIKILKDAHYSGWIAFEYEATDPPLEAIPIWLKKLEVAMQAT